MFAIGLLVGFVLGAAAMWLLLLVAAASAERIRQERRGWDQQGESRADLALTAVVLLIAIAGVLLGGWWG